MGMYVRSIKRKNKDGSEVEYIQLAHNTRHPEKGYSRAEVVYSFGRRDQLDVAALKRLVSSLSRFISPEDAQELEAQGTGIKFISSQPAGGALLLKGLWERIGIDQCISEALKDRGMTSEENRRNLQRAGGQYILGEKLRGTTINEEALNRGGRFKIIKENLHTKEVFVGEGTGRRRFVIAYNPEQAKHDRHVRKKNLERIKVELECGLRHRQGDQRRKVFSGHGKSVHVYSGRPGPCPGKFRKHSPGTG
jgi:hypothetical protein